MNGLLRVALLAVPMSLADNIEAADLTCGLTPLRGEGLNVPVRAVFKPNRFQYLPNTLRRLLEGEDLQVVALGDSIVGDTFGPQYAGIGWHLGTAWGVEQVAATFGTDIYAGVSVLGSTGAWHYRLPGNVQAYVLPYQPDLVVIGGISNRDDIEAIRDVILQIRSARPDTEFILMTGAVNLQSMPTNSLLLLNDNAANYEGRLSRLADDVGAAFINTRGSYDEFIIEAHRSASVDQAYFQRDPIHANDRGRAILREIFTAFFRPLAPCPDGATSQRAMALPLITVTPSNSPESQLEPIRIPQSIAGPTETIIDQIMSDIDGDGRDERLALVATSSIGTQRLRISRGTSAAFSTTIVPLNLIGGTSLFLADINGDTLPDLVVGTGASQPYLYLYFNSGVAGRWYFDPQVLHKSGDSTCTLAVKILDLNADGRTDLMTANGCTPEGVVDYYPLGSTVPLNRLAPESYVTGLDITGLKLGSESAQHVGPTLLFYGNANGQPQLKELGVVRSGIKPDAESSTRSGGGSFAWFEALFFTMLTAVRCRRRLARQSSVRDNERCEASS